MSKINSDDVKEYFAAGGKFVKDQVVKSYGDIINKEGEEAFSEAFEVGIKNTIAALYDTNVDDDEIIRVLNKFWGINRHEAKERLIFEKGQSTIRELTIFLKMEGYTTKEINKFMISNMAFSKIRHNSEFWKLRYKPEKLMKEIQDSK